MKPAELRAMTEAQLDEQLTDLHVEWRTHRFDEAIRKDIARIHTIRTERQMDAALRSRLGAGR
jgi:ribosomal protein L29